LDRERARPGANYFAVLADNSQGMKIKDRAPHARAARTWRRAHL